MNASWDHAQDTMLNPSLREKGQCYGCWFNGKPIKGCGCTIKPDDPCPESDNGQHEWKELYHAWHLEGDAELIGRRCIECGVQDIS